MPKKAKKAPAGGKRQATAKPADQPLEYEHAGLEDRSARGFASPDGKRFPVVGVGASAGGLEAFLSLLRHLPADTGMSFVLVQHMDPKHESMLVELLGKSSSMHVQQIRDGMKVQPDCVFVIPPNTDLILENSTLRLLSRSLSRGQHMPIDRFFRSMADQLQERAIGVILSGTSSDGALGIEAIKAQGGITFAQDEKTAKYDGMPRAAVATGMVDFVLPAHRIAEELARIGNHPYVRKPDDILEQQTAEGRPQEPLSRVFALLRSATGVDFGLYKHTTIRRRIGRRMAVHKIDNVDRYVQLLVSNPAEIEALYRELLIKVTGFFRDAEVFNFLKSDVLPRITSQTAQDSPIRVWIPGCATGEEAYSVAIVLLEHLSEKNLHSPVQIFATDVSEDAIEKARSGAYVENIALDVSAERLRRFFIKRDGGYQVNKNVRDLCVFARQNLAKDPPFSRLDLISCRNVLIYLEPVLQKRVIPMFHYALKPDGMLLLGSSETITPFADLFTLDDKKHKVYRKRMVAGGQRFDLDTGKFVHPGEGSGPPPPRPDEETSSFDLQKEADRIIVSRYGPAGVLINEDYEVIQFRGKTGPFLEPAPGKATLNLLKMLREGLLLEVRNTVQKAKRSGQPAHKDHVPAKDENGFREVTIDVIPLQPSARGKHFLVLFEHAKPEPAGPKSRGKGAVAAEERQVEQLKQELVATRQYLQSIIEEQEATNEELQSANEEILSSNEELQSINEELETAKEELQSTNEELTTVNEELQNRNAELSQTNDDLNNLLASVNIPIVMLGADLRIRRFTPMAGRVLRLIPTDLGRPITDLRATIQLPDLGSIIGDVISAVTPRETEVQDQDGHWYSLSIRPYRTSDNRIDGAVLALLDIDTIKRGLQRTESAEHDMAPQEKPT